MNEAGITMTSMFAKNLCKYMQERWVNLHKEATTPRLIKNIDEIFGQLWEGKSRVSQFVRKGSTLRAEAVSKIGQCRNYKHIGWGQTIGKRICIELFLRKILYFDIDTNTDEFKLCAHVYSADV